VYVRNFGVRTNTSGEDQLFNKKSPNFYVPYIEEWSAIVEGAHCKGKGHLVYKDMVKKIGKAGWHVGAQVNGIPKAFIEKVIASCVRCQAGRVIQS
jgi:hypothetical protein